MHSADETGGPGATEEGPAALQEGPAPFGTQEATRFAADVEYRGRVGAHDYLVRARHRFLDTSCTVEIDGVAHDPKAEEKARTKKTAKAEGDARGEKTAKAGGAADAGVDGEAGDDLRFRVEESFTVVYCTVRRPDEDGEHADAEVIAVRTAGLGGAGEVDVRQGLTRRPLAPLEGSPSAVRDRKRTAHPTRYALLAAVTKAATFLIPLLGLGALFSGILRPVREWVAGVVTAAIEAILGVVDPIVEWIDELLRPLREFLDELTRPVREFLSALVQPVRGFVDWLRDLLSGLFEGLSLPFDVPGWVVDVAVPVIVVLVVFAVTFRGLRKRNSRLEAARASAVSPEPEASARSGAAGERPSAGEWVESGERDGPEADGSAELGSPEAHGRDDTDSPEADGSDDPGDTDAGAPARDGGHGSSTP